MQWQSTPYILLLFLAAIASLLWTVFGISKLRSDGQKPHVLAFVALTISVAIWCAVYAVQLASTTLEAKLTAYILLHVGAVMVPPTWFVFALTYTGRADWITPPTVAALVAIPLMLLVALPTNPYSIALIDVTVETYGSQTSLVTENGLLYQLHLGYSYVLIIVGTALIVDHALRSSSSIRRQALLLVVGSTVPLVLNVFNVLGLPPFDGIGVNLTPVSLSLATVLIGVAIFRYRMLELAPIARDVVLLQMQEGVIVLDADERIVDSNPAARAVLGEQLPFDTPISSVIPQYDRLDREDPALVEHERDDGTELFVRLARSPLVVGGETHGWAVLIQDVTVSETQRRVLKRQNERLDMFAKVVSHDLRNQLAVIAGYTDLAEQTGNPGHFGEVRETVSRMDTFMEDLLQISQQGETIDEVRPVSLPAVVDTIETSNAEDQFAVSITTDAVVMADPARLLQVLDNLFRNAWTHADGEVEIHVGELPDGFFIEDDGPGIPEAERDTVFELGFSTRTNGSGVGLTIVRDIVEAHGWSISVTEGAEGGTRFEITGVEFHDPDWS